ncbi:metallophosphoesterase [Tenacibaculum geojense]|uniref:Metallophosphoesterase n=1 Tax=Tenacibaculum geojense TaxID=915352 RepID=A0ABW3JNU2_9FLAO
MKKRIIRYFKHILLTLVFLLFAGSLLLIYLNGTFNYGQSPLTYELNKEGPYVFYKNDSILEVNYLKGNKLDGFDVDKYSKNIYTNPTLSCYFSLDSSSFSFKITPNPAIPASIYNDENKILAISDIESGYKTFRDFLIKNKVINNQLSWTFGKNHLVLLGDFVDRGHSTTQVLWFIYKLEQEAKKYGGFVHFIIGNHELYNMQGQFKSSKKKYYAIASILEEQQQTLYSKKSVLGKWLSSKNSIENINGVLFTHGGLHPDITTYDVSLSQINAISRANYYKPYFPKPQKDVTQFVLSNKTGVCWYRGYFKDDLQDDAIANSISKFNANAIVVGHTLQSKVKKLYNGKVYAIDVPHPKDYVDAWPNYKSEGLLIDTNNFYRVLATGKQIKL